MPKKTAFKPGDKVAWHHVFATQHAPGSIIRASAAPDDAEIGEVLDVANDEGTYFTVKFKGGKERVLTADELVKVADDA